MFLEPLENEGTALERQRRVDAVVARGPGGAFALAGTATAIVLALWVAFYLIVFVARGPGG